MTITQYLPIIIILAVAIYVIARDFINATK